MAYATAIRAANRGFINSSVILIMFLILTTYVLTKDKTPSARMVFTSLGLLFQLRITAIFYFSQSILGFKEFFVGVKRIGVHFSDLTIHITSMFGRTTPMYFSHHGAPKHGSDVYC